MLGETLRSGVRLAFTLLWLGGLAAAVGAQSGAPAAVTPHALIPPELRGLTAAQFNSRALAQHKAGNFGGPGQLFFYATLAAPNEARGHFNLACVFALLHLDSAAAAELRRAAQLDRKWATANLDDPDLDDIRQGVAYSDFLSWFTGTRGLPTGEWVGGSRAPLAGLKFPSWLKGTEAESDAFDASRLVIDASNQVELSLGSSPQRFLFRGRATADGSIVTLDGWTRQPDDQGEDREVPALCLLTLRRLAPDILRMDVLLDFTTGKAVPLTEYFGRFGPSAAAAMERRGGGWYWAGTRDGDEGPPQPVGGILEMRLLAPNWLGVTSLVSSADWAYIIHGVYRRYEDSRR